MINQPFSSTFQIDINRLNWSKERNTFSAEASSLGIGSWTKRIAINNHQTKKSRIFSLVKKHTDSEGDVTHLEYQPDHIESINYPEVKGISLIIWND